MATITVIGRAQVSVPPDEATVNLRVEGSEALAAGLGVRVGAVAEAVEGESRRPLPFSREAAFAPLLSAPPIGAGEAAVVAAVTVTFQVEPA